MSTSVARAWVPRRKSAHVPLSRPRAFPQTGSTIDIERYDRCPRISSPRMRKLHDRENDLYKPRMSQTFRIFFFSRLINPFKIIP